MLRLLHAAIDKGTVEALEELLERARSGQIIGLAYVALHPGDGYSADIIGAVKDHKLLARGICRALEDSIK